MTTAARIWLSAGVLAAALLVQGGLMAHMMMGPVNTYPALRKPLAELTTELIVERKGASPFVWQFETVPIEEEVRKSLPYVPLDMIFRFGRCPDPNLAAQCYIVQSEYGEDRKHHPEICMRDVLQIPEDKSAAAIVELGGDKNRPVQRFSFTKGPNQTYTVYYWHYTFQPEVSGEQTWLQALHQTYRRPPPSMTVQVTTTADRERWPMIERDLIATLDEKLRSTHLPRGVRMGCDRLSIAIVPK